MDGKSNAVAVARLYHFKLRLPVPFQKVRVKDNIYE